MSVAPAKSIYESTFAQSDTTNAILVVEGKKLHVNKTLLSCHSDYFKALFNADFAEKSMTEIPIKDVKFKDFATLLSLVQHNPIMPTEENAERLLELADRFLLPAAKRHLELFITTTNLSPAKKIELADKYNFQILMQLALKLFTKADDVAQMGKYSGFTSDTKAKLFERHFELLPKNKPEKEFEYGENGNCLPSTVLEPRLAGYVPPHLRPPPSTSNSIRRSPPHGFVPPHLRQRGAH